MKKQKNAPHETSGTVETAKRAYRNDEQLDEETIEQLATEFQNGVDLSPEVEGVVKRMMESRNRTKPVGLKIGDDEAVDLVAEEDSVGSDADDDEQRRSFIESFHYHAEIKTDEEELVPPSSMIPAVAKLIDVSALPNPDGDLLTYVEEVYSELTMMNMPGNE